MERYIAIDGVCAWPNLTLMPDGEMVATIFNQPCHGRWEGDVECWASGDGGRTWRFRGTPAPHDPGSNRMNVAAGVSPRGELIVIASGWSNRPTRREAEAGQTVDFSEARVLPAWVSRSSDGGRTWQVSRSFPRAPEDGMSEVIPFGDVLPGRDGALHVSGYAGKAGEMHAYNSSYFFCSRDDGRTWGEGVTISWGRHNETAPLHLGEGRWLAACRGVAPADRVDLFVSTDDGRSWRLGCELSLPRQHPAHLSQLADGRVLLVYGNRASRMWGIDARVSADGGGTWSAPVRLVELAATDLGYPSCVQRSDGKVVTAWYAGSSSEHHRYHMGVGIWDTEEFFPVRKKK